MKPKPPFKILFLCKTNSTSSLLAEAIANKLGRGQLIAYSAGPCPASSVPREVFIALRNHKIPAKTLRPKSWNEFARPTAPGMDFIITLGKFPGSRTPPVWAGHPTPMHWPLKDPSDLKGPEAERHIAFSLTTELLEAHVVILLQLVKSAGVFELASRYRSVLEKMERLDRTHFKAAAMTQAKKPRPRRTTRVQPPPDPKCSTDELGKPARASRRRQRDV